MLKRISLLVVAAVAVVVLLVVIATPDDRTSSLSAAEVREAGAGPATVSQPFDSEAVQRLEVSGDGAAVSGPRKLTYQRGDVIRLEVDVDSADTVHIADYGLSQPVEAGGRAVFDFRADIEGTSQIQLLDAGRQIGLLKVGP